MGVSRDGIVADWEREQALDKDLTVRCSWCGWEETGPSPRALKSQAAHRRRCPGRPVGAANDPLLDDVCMHGHRGMFVGRTRRNGSTSRECRGCVRESARRQALEAKLARDGATG